MLNSVWAIEEETEAARQEEIVLEDTKGENGEEIKLSIHALYSNQVGITIKLKMGG